MLNQGTTDERLTDEIPDAEPSSPLPAERQKTPKYDTDDIVEELTFEEIQKLRQWEENRPENWNPYDDDLVNDTIEHQFGGYDVVKVAKAQGKEEEKGGTWLQGSVRRIRYQKGSKRPPIIWPEIWKLASLARSNEVPTAMGTSPSGRDGAPRNSNPTRTNRHVHP